jgi:hypothetical protein
MVIDDFVTEQECDALISQVKDNLQVSSCSLDTLFFFFLLSICRK